MIAGWIIAGIVILVFFMVIFRSQNIIFFSSVVWRYFLIALAVGIVLFFAFSVYNTYDSYDADLTSFSGVVDFGGHYFAWLGGVFHNVGDITGYAIQQDWFNSTNTTGK